MQPWKITKQVWPIPGLVGYYQKFIKNFSQIKKLLITLMHHDAKFNGTLDHQAAFLSLKGALIQAPILHCPDHSKLDVVYMDVSDDACGAQLSQENNGQELPVTFLSHTFMNTQQKWSTPKQEACGVYYTITKWNCYLQGSDIIVHNDHKPL